MDDVDTASEIVEARNNAGLKAVLTSADDHLPVTGICRRCGQPIEADRRAAQPKARDCKECAQEAEQERRLQRLRGPR